MKNITLARIFDFLVTSAVIFVLSYIWFNYSGIKTLPAITYSLVLALCISAVIDLIVLKRKEKRFKSSSRQKAREEKILQLVYSPTENVLDYFYNMLRQDRCVSKSGDCLLITSKTGKLIPAFCKFSVDKLVANDVIDIYTKSQKYNPSKIIILASNVSPQALSTAQAILNVNIVILDETEVYKLMEKYNTFPPTSVCLKTSGKLKIKQLISFALIRKRTKAYLFSSVFLVLASLVVRYSLYYVVFSSILLVLSLLAFKNIGVPSQQKNPL